MQLVHCYIWYRHRKGRRTQVRVRGHDYDLYMSCFVFYCLPPSPPLLHFSLCLSIPPQLHFTAWTPTEWKTAGSGTAQNTLCPILQWIPIYLSPLLLCPARSLAPCPHLRWGRAAETKEKQLVWEHVSHPHMVLSPSLPFCEFVSQPYSLVILWCYGWFCSWQVENRWDITQLSCMAKYVYS